MKIAIATGINSLDQNIQKSIQEEIGDAEVKIVGYRKFILQNTYDIAVISKKLPDEKEIDIDQLFFTIRKNKTRIIFLTTVYDAEDIKRCLDYSIYDILFDPVKISDVIKLIEKPKSFSDIADIYDKYKDVKINKKSSDSEVKVVEKEGPVKVVEKVVEKPIMVEKTIYKIRTVKQKILTFYTTDNSLLTADLITQFGTLLSKRTDQKILVADFNTLYPVMDYMFGIDKNIGIESRYDVGDNTSMAAMRNAIDRNMLNVETFPEFVIKHPKYKSIDIITSSHDLTLFEKLTKVHYEKILDIAQRLYDTILINTNPNIDLASTFIPLIRATDIICVTEGNYPEMANLSYCINELKAKIPKNSFHIIVDNYSENSVDKEVVNSIFKDSDILGYIKYSKEKERYLNKQKIYIDGLNDKKASDYLDVITKLGYTTKVPLLDRIFKNKPKYSNVNTTSM